MGGARWDDWRTGCLLPTGGAASLPMCQLAWRSGCSAADRTLTSSGASAADMPPSAATGAAVEPQRALHRTRYSAARLRAWRVTGVAFGTAEHRAERSAATCEHGPIAKRASVMRSMTDEETRDPRARERAATCLRRLRRPDCVRVRDGSRAGARRWAFDSGSTRCATARPCATGTRPGSTSRSTPRQQMPPQPQTQPAHENHQSLSPIQQGLCMPPSPTPRQVPRRRTSTPESVFTTATASARRITPPWPTPKALSPSASRLTRSPRRFGPSCRTATGNPSWLYPSRGRAGRLCSWWTPVH